jgi:hypothetical protein
VVDEQQLTIRHVVPTGPVKLQTGPQRNRIQRTSETEQATTQTATVGAGAGVGRYRTDISHTD